MKLIQNALRCPDGTIISSIGRHDFVTHTQDDGRTYAVDGGLDYPRKLFSDKEYENLTVYDDDDHSRKRHILWGSYGINGDEDISLNPISDLSNEHLSAIIGGGHGCFDVREIIADEIRFRGVINVPHFGSDGGFIDLPVKSIATHCLRDMLNSGLYDCVKLEMIRDEIKLRTGVEK